MQSTMTFDTILNLTKQLSPDDQFRLLEWLGGQFKSVFKPISPADKSNPQLEIAELEKRRERTIADRKKIAQEQSWWLNLPLNERTKYEGQFVAVHNCKLIDHDTDRIALRRRIRAKYGQMAILLMPAEGPSEIHMFSPRLMGKVYND